MSFMSQRDVFFRALLHLYRDDRVGSVSEVLRETITLDSPLWDLQGHETNAAAALIGDIVDFVESNNMEFSRGIAELIDEIAEGERFHFFLPAKPNKDKSIRALRMLGIDLDDKIRSGAYETQY